MWVLSMLSKYGYLGLALIIFAQINFIAKISPFDTWYIPIVWYGFILFVDSLVYKVKKKSLISSYPKEFLLILVLSIPFWSIFEIYNIFTASWYYVNYVWYVHLVDFTTIMPAIMETFSLFTVLELGKRFDKNIKISDSAKSHKKNVDIHSPNAMKFLIIIGALAVIIPFVAPIVGFPFLWFGIFLFLDPINYLTGRPSLIRLFFSGRRSTIIRLFMAGITMGFFWEFWNYQAYPKWFYSIPYLMHGIRLFEMPLIGYLGYLGFALEVFVFYALFRSLIFRKGNDLLDI
jgi:hypothetical protein